MLLHGNSEAQMIIVTDQTVKVHNLKNSIMTIICCANNIHKIIVWI